MNRRGFTLIELLAVIVVLAILAGVAVPRYIDYSQRARQSVVRGVLANVRYAIVNFRMERGVVDGTPRWPTFVELTTPGVVLTEAIPFNPFQDRSLGGALVVDSGDPPPYTEDDDHWNYHPATGQFWANTTTLGENLW